MSTATLLGICAACLVGLGLYGLIVQSAPLRKILAFNILGGGIFLLFGAIARRGAAAGMGGDPIPQALAITGLVVAFSATALGVAILLRLFEETGGTSLRGDSSKESQAQETDSCCFQKHLLPQTQALFSCWPSHCQSRAFCWSY
jgi:multicomponent Na+:H+ antiporter subunit C